MTGSDEYIFYQEICNRSEHALFFQRFLYKKMLS